MNPSTSNSEPPNPPQPSYRPKGKIAWLPKAVRDQINHMLLEGFTYAAVIKNLGDAGRDLNINNLYRYHKNQYRHWLREQHWLADARARQETAIELLRDLDLGNLNQAAIQMALLQIYDALHDFSVGDLKEKLAGEPGNYSRILNALSRLSKENLSMRKYHDHCATNRAALPKLDPKRELTRAEDDAIFERMDALFKRRRRRPVQNSPTAPALPAASTSGPGPAQPPPNTPSPNGTPPT